MGRVTQHSEAPQRHSQQSALVRLNWLLRTEQHMGRPAGKLPRRKGAPLAPAAVPGMRWLLRGKCGEGRHTARALVSSAAADTSTSRSALMPARTDPALAARVRTPWQVVLCLPGQIRWSGWVAPVALQVASCQVARVRRVNEGAKTKGRARGSGRSGVIGASTDPRKHAAFESPRESTGRPRVTESLYPTSKRRMRASTRATHTKTAG